MFFQKYHCAKKQQKIEITTTFRKHALWIPGATTYSAAAMSDAWNWIEYM